MPSTQRIPLWRVHTVTCGKFSRPCSPQARDTVVVTEVGFWWMGDVIYKEGGARDPKVPTLFQIACVDTGVIRWVNADLVTHVVPAT